MGFPTNNFLNFFMIHNPNRTVFFIIIVVLPHTVIFSSFYNVPLVGIEDVMIEINPIPSVSIV